MQGISYTGEGRAEEQGRSSYYQPSEPKSWEAWEHKVEGPANREREGRQGLLPSSHPQRPASACQKPVYVKAWESQPCSVRLPVTEQSRGKLKKESEHMQAPAWYNPFFLPLSIYSSMQFSCSCKIKKKKKKDENIFN